MHGRSGSSYAILRSYILRQFLVSLLVAFLFFFFIFFINQLLLFAQRILLKNVNVLSVMKLVGLSIPQIMLYTIPFSTLSAAAMVIGDLSERNEILALRASGIPLRKMFAPIAVCALLLAVGTFLVADILVPYSNQRFRTIYAQLMRDLPTLEIEPYAVNRVGDIVLVTGNVTDDNIGPLVLFDTAQGSTNQVISASGGSITLMDLETFLYRLELQDPVILATDRNALDDFTMAEAKEMIYYLDFSSQVSRFTDVTPTQLSTRDLLSAIALRAGDQEREEMARMASLRTLERQVSDLMRTITVQDQTIDPSLVATITSLQQDIQRIKTRQGINFYLQYYRAELHKKFALSFSCFVLVFITFPLSFVRLKHGRLFGFGLSLVVASFYWFLLFFAQTKILDFPANPGFLIWGPNAVVAIIAFFLLVRTRRV
ncbi:MAG: LptF/LptG family permease [Sphaerochaetaceae bacterium]|jgi:lipopolysaccharide export system permease protein|nr:LptF/LptG family permease [Sphaerochaetaceae bacterium]